MYITGWSCNRIVRAYMCRLRTSHTNRVLLLLAASLRMAVKVSYHTPEMLTILGPYTRV